MLASVLEGSGRVGGYRPLGFRAGPPHQPVFKRGHRGRGPIDPMRAGVWCRGEVAQRAVQLRSPADTSRAQHFIADWIGQAGGMCWFDVDRQRSVRLRDQALLLRQVYGCASALAGRLAGLTDAADRHAARIQAWC